METLIEGRARLLGDDINTDYIIASTRKRDTLDEHLLKQYLLETVDPGFAASVRTNDIIVAGRNFGCGSAMEIAATVILAAGIPVVIARSFARTFFRNAINNGLLPVECDAGQIVEGASLRVTLDDALIRVTDLSRDTEVATVSLSPLMRDILDAGGLVPYMAGGGFT